MKKLLYLIVPFSFGFILGVIVMCYLSMRASSSFLEIVRLNYEIEQHILAIQAKKLGKMDQAIIHYANLVSVSSTDGLYCFSKTRKYWSPTFPFASLVLEQISNRAHSKITRETEGINRAIFANALEKAGKYEEANLEYLKASQLLGCDSIAKAKKIAEEILSTEEELLKSQKKYINAAGGGP